MKFALSREDFSLLMLALGIAASGAFKDDNPQLGRSIWRLANTVNKDNPDWLPYEVGPGVESPSIAGESSQPLDKQNGSVS